MVNHMSYLGHQDLEKVFRVFIAYGVTQKSKRRRKEFIFYKPRAL